MMRKVTQIKSCKGARCAHWRPQNWQLLNNFWSTSRVSVPIRLARHPWKQDQSLPESPGITKNLPVPVIHMQSALDFGSLDGASVNVCLHNMYYRHTAYSNWERERDFLTQKITEHNHVFCTRGHWNSDEACIFSCTLCIHDIHKTSMSAKQQKPECEWHIDD